MRRGTIAGIASRGISLVAGLVTIPVLLHYFGPTQFGIWATVTSLTALLSFADLGLSNGLVNAIADADAVGDRSAMRRDVSSAVILLCLVGMGLIGLVVVISQFIGLGSLVSSAHTSGASEAVLAFAICFVVGIPLSVLMRIRVGLQESVAAYMWLALGNVLGLVAVLAVVFFGGSLTLAVAATAGGPVIAAALNAVVLFGFRQPWLTPRAALATFARMAFLLRSGALFFVIQVCFAISYQSDALVISHILGADAVTEYTVPMRLFYFSPVVLNFALLPFWPAVRNALAHGDILWAKRTFIRIAAIGIGTVLAVTLVLLIAGPRIIDLWTNGEVSPAGSLLVALALWAMTTSIITPLGYFIAGIGTLRFLASMQVVMTIVNLGLSIVLAHAVGVAGVAFASATADVVCVIVPTAIYLPRLLARLETRKNLSSSILRERAALS